MTNEEQRELNIHFEELKNGNSQALEPIYLTMHPYLVNIYKRKLPNPELVKELISETFSIVIQKVQTVIFNKNCCAWICKIAKFVFKNLNRREYKHSLENNLDFIPELKDKDVLISVALMKLDPITREVIYLKYYKDLTEVEIVKVLKISKSSVSRRHQSGIQKLKGMIDNE